MARKQSNNPTNYELILVHIFKAAHKPGSEVVQFKREDIVGAAKALKINLPKNLGDVVYSFRYRVDMPTLISKTAPKGKHWIIAAAGRSVYKFVLRDELRIVPTKGKAVVKIPDATPGIIVKYAQSDEQALLAVLRYNRLIDIFTKVTCYSLQNHLRTTVPELGQIETDELYVCVDRSGTQFVVPVQAKGGKDRLSEVQIEQDIALCKAKFASLVCIPVAAQFLEGNRVVLFSFIEQDAGVKISSEVHFQLVAPDSISDVELRAYREAAGAVD